MQAALTLLIVKSSECFLQKYTYNNGINLACKKKNLNCSSSILSKLSPQNINFGFFKNVFKMQYGEDFL